MFEEGDTRFGRARGLATLASGELSEAGTEVSGASVVLDAIPHGERWRITDSGHLPLSPASGGRPNLSLLEGSLGGRKALRGEGHMHEVETSLWWSEAPRGSGVAEQQLRDTHLVPVMPPHSTAAWRKR